MIELRDKLRALGYDARLVNGDCFDIHQGSAIHYLSKKEAMALAEASGTHPLTLSQYIDPAFHGLNRWYAFPSTTTGREG